MKRPEPLDEEIVLDPKRYLVSETDAKGVITYSNSYFREIVGYSEEELIGQPHSLIRHPDMPKLVFKLLWDTIGSGQNINAVVKNLAKDGRYYWVFTEFNIKKDADSGEIIGYMASRKAVSKHVVAIISELYKNLLEIENSDGLDVAQEYLDKFLKEKGNDVTFSNIMENIHKFY
ncbi:MAG: PAS domain-containing protein [Campylobacterota bacterium]|nr:PAS domain-containing protein [Campylobacterota bacterium]